MTTTKACVSPGGFAILDYFMPADHNPFAIVLGLPITRVWRGYRSAFFLELGQVHIGKGEATIGIDVCPWRLLHTGSELLTHQAAPATLDAQLAVLEGRTVQEVRVDRQRQCAKITLSDSYAIETAHMHEGQAWYVLTPMHNISIRTGCVVVVEPHRSQAAA